MRTKRIGSTTAGISLIALGIVFLLHILLPSPELLGIALRFWPLILIMLGIELLIATYHKSETERKYDFASIVMMILCVLFAFSCEAARQSIQYLQK